jgi:hypothetical protein
MAPRTTVQNQKNPSPCILQTLRIIFKRGTILIETINLRKIEVGLGQGSVLGPVLYRNYTSKLPTSENTTTATFADETAILTKDEVPAIASMKLQDAISKINYETKKWRIKINQSKFKHILFTLCNQTCPTVLMGNVVLPPQKTK